MIKAVSLNKGIDLIIHLGDVVKDIERIKEQYGGFRYEYVRGNNDWSGNCPEEKILELEGKRVLITHGHRYGVKYGYQGIEDKGRSEGVDAVFFGHTHRTEEITAGRILLLNPGSISLPVHPDRPTYSIVEIKGDRMTSRFFGI